MKNLLLLCLLFILGMSNLYPQRLDSIPHQEQILNEDLSTILQRWEKKYDLKFFYQKDWIPDQVISISFSEVSLGQALKQLLDPYDLGLSAYNDQLIIIAPQSQLSASIQLETTQQAFIAAANYISLGDSSLSLNELVKLQGRITDLQNGKVVKGARIEMEGTGRGAITDQAGRFEIDLLPGIYQVIIRADGYADMVEDIRLWSTANWDLKLDLQAYRLDEVLLEAEASDQNVSGAQIGLNRLSIREIKRIPAFLGEVDVIKSILTLPGVNTAGEGASGFNVRGGNIDQNLILLDGAPVFNSSHMLGFFSIFNGDIVNDLSLYKGSIPAQFGGRLSSVLDVKTREPNESYWKARGGLGLISSRIAIEGPINKGQTTLMASARASYADWILSLAQNIDVSNSAANYYEGNIKINQKVGRKGKISLAAYASKDQFQFASDYGYSWSTLLGNMSYRHLFSERFSSTTQFVSGRYRSEYFDPEGQDAFELSNGIQYMKAYQQFLWVPNSQHEIYFGLEMNEYQGLDEVIEPLGADSGIIPQTVEKDRGREWAAFLNESWNIGELITLSAGIRYSYFQYLGEDLVRQYAEGQARNNNTVIDSTQYGPGDVIGSYGGFEPRLALRISLDDQSSLKMSYNRLRQYIHLISNTSAATPVDVWQVSTSHIQPQIADNYSAGYFRNFNDNEWETSLEVYYKDIEQTIDFKDLPSLLLNQHIETELLNGRGRAYGAELSLKRTRGKLSGWLNYTYARSWRQVRGSLPSEVINEGDWYPAFFDQPHQLNLAASFRPNKRNLFSANFTFSSGRPITAPVGDYFIGGTLIPHYSPRNQFRIPDYHRLDIAYTLDPQVIRKRKFKSTFTFSIYNVYLRKNAFSVFFERTDKFIPDAFRLAILGTAFPSITYNFRF